MDLLAVDVGHYDTLALSDEETRVWGVGCGVWRVGCGVWGVGCGVWEDGEMGKWGDGEMWSVGDQESIALSNLIRYTGFFNYSLFPVPCSLFPIPHSRFPIPDSRFPIPDSLPFCSTIPTHNPVRRNPQMIGNDHHLVN
ncbi:hypothetical protein [Moorena bouillonii]|uniref:hypothetical protein n=1 Tax=Moorena bouillonii TaxID=207920 RepID=UPI0013013400|nr:hypothetical protein [Moorena bouillonii]